MITEINFYQVSKLDKVLQCAVPENQHTLPTEGIGIPSGVGGSVRPNNFKKKCMKLNCNAQRGV